MKVSTGRMEQGLGEVGRVRYLREEAWQGESGMGSEDSEMKNKAINI